MGYRVLLWATVLGFAVTLAIVVGQRLSAEAMAVMVGVVAGVAASIPASLIVVWVATRNTEPRAVEAPRPAPAPETMIVVVTPPPAPAPTSYAYPAAYAAPPPMVPSAVPSAGSGRWLGAGANPRTFTVIGGGGLDDE